MASVYVSGPVQREGATLPSWVGAAYEEAYLSVGSLHADAIMPHSDRRLEAMDARMFYSEIESRISSVDAAIIVFTGQDVSAGIEAAVASFRGKKVMIVSKDLEGVPRLLRGLPNVINSVEYTGRESMSGPLIAFLQEVLPGRSRTTSQAF